MAEPIWALGMMSGTSLDGIDAALVLTDGETISAFGPGAETPFRAGEMRHVEAVMGDWRAFRPPAGAARADKLLKAERDVLRAHAAAAAALLADAAEAPAVIGFHGQTVAHAPDEGWTWQIGDGAALARALNRPVVWDFRSDDMKAGGEGAPLAPFFHFALAKHIGAAVPVAFLNIGGVANVTWVNPALSAPETAGALVAFDTGPGNALINDWMARRTGAPLDRDGAAAGAGRVSRAALRSNAAAAYLDRKPPKSLDRNEFAAVLAAVDGLSVEDGAATLTALTAETVAESLRHMPAPPSRWLVCGGGRRNGAMMRMLGERIDAPVDPVEAVGLDGDLIEAQAFAYLAVRVMRGLPISAPATTGCAAPVAGGRISRSDRNPAQVQVIATRTRIPPSSAPETKTPARG
ncbi:anhydro-N-acetylmuramic acid kinase [Pikeienuella piscinae]|uniref:Anhydro-N-acetylmuramic acid kinase n=1 Tax=Pikeienuella piscinae TaxID=2748098 RepID=A0A7L5BYM6_9RHOB|nr:anhydro-N-acetylmuramic acid kinase [Pikeienuella piscinae]QIE55346.1 anhydro-N-acetylmuramic acid kinase [Pikeienuella piscinae]